MGSTLHYDNVLPPPDNTDIALAKQVTFAELDFAIDQNIAKIYGSYEEMQDDILWMYKLFRDRFPEQEQSLEVVHQPQPKQVKIRKIKANTNKNDVSEAKKLWAFDQASAITRSLRDYQYLTLVFPCPSSIIFIIIYSLYS